MAADLIVGADFGTSGVKVALVGQDMVVRHHSFAPYPLSLPGPDMAEQNPSDWWAAFALALQTLKQEAGDLTGRIAAISICAQFCGVVPVDGGGEPLRPALIWLDKRAAPQARKLAGGFPTVVGYNLAKAARWFVVANGAPSRNGMDPPCKMIWLRDCEPETWRRTRHLLDVKDWLVARATGVIMTTGDSANMTWMMDSRQGRSGWSPALQRLVGIPSEMLAPIIDGGSVAGTLLTSAARELGLDPGTPVMAGTNDVTAAALGSGAVGDGQLHISIGQSSWVGCFHSRRIISPTASFATIDSGLSHRPLLIATQESAGAALDWVDNVTGATGDVTGERTAHDPFFIPWLAGERVPMDDERMRASFTGLSLMHDGDALCRAVIEGVAFNTRWAFDKVARKLGLSPDRQPLPLVGGGALNPHLVQTLANVLDRPIRLGRNRLAGVSGAAAIGAAHAGWFKDVWTAAGAIAPGEGHLVEPQPVGVELEAARYRRLESLRPHLIRHYQKFGSAGVP
ncbi:MAG: FGGY family carbohydrate kinase [Mesorhizobium sp.]